MLQINRKILIACIAGCLAIFNLTACTTSQVKINSANKTINIQEWKTVNGARVLYVYAPELPMVDIQAIFDAGSVRDGNKSGLANLTNGLLSHGAVLNNKTLSVDDISERFDSVGAQFGASASKDNAEISLRSLTDEKWLQTAVDTMQAIINAPSFDKKELERVRKQLLISFEGRKQSPATIASDLFYKNLYKNHPYALPSVGTEDNAKKFSRADLVNFYKKYYVANNALVTIVGDVSRAQAEKLAEKIIGKLPAGEKAKTLAEVEKPDVASVTHFEYPSSQTHILAGQIGMNRTDKDYFTLYVANHILGGSGFGSRIMQEIREKRGLAYSSYSYFSPMYKPGPFIIGLQTSNKQTDEAMTVLKQTLRKFINEGPSEKELLHAKKNITGGFALRVDSNSDISSYLGVIGFYHLPLTYLKDFNAKIEAVTLAQIKETFQRRIDPDKMVIVTVGEKTAGRK